MRKAKGMVSTTSQMTAHDDDGDPFAVSPPVRVGG